MLSPVLEHHEKWYYSYQRKKPSEKLLANLDKEKITKIYLPRRFYPGGGQFLKPEYYCHEIWHANPLILK